MAEAHVLALLRIAGPTSDRMIAFFHPFLAEGKHWTPLTDVQLLEARVALERAGLVEDSGNVDWRGGVEWAAT